MYYNNNFLGLLKDVKSIKKPTKVFSSYFANNFS